VSAACAVDKPTSTTAGAMHAKRRNTLGEAPRQSEPFKRTHRYGSCIANAAANIA